jgi:hypothetical protein
VEKLSDVFEAVRRPYVASFEMALRSMPGRRILVEPAAKERTGQLKRLGRLKTGLRADVLLEAEGGLSPIRLATPTNLNFETIVLENFGGFQSALFDPFEWFHCRIRLHNERPDWAALGGWFERWFIGEDDFVAPREAMPRGLVHCLDDPEQLNKPGQFELKVDLGTASGDAMFELLGALVECGTQHVWIGG